MSDERLLTVKEVAQCLRKHPRTIRRWIVTGKIKGQRIPGRGRRGIEYLIREIDLEAFLNEQKT